MLLYIFVYIAYCTCDSVYMTNSYYSAAHEVLTTYIHHFDCRTLPGEVYIASAGGFYRKGPMSKTVTLTYPYNPFKKLNEFHCNI